MKSGTTVRWPLLPKRGRRRIPLKAWAELWEDFASFLQAGMAMDSALDVLIPWKSVTLARMMKEWKEGLREGRTLSELYASSGHHLVWLPLIRVGEATGDLARMMRVLGEQAGQLHRYRMQVLAQLAYPLTVMGATLLVCVLFLFVVLPRITAFYESMGISVPAVLDPDRLMRGAGGALAGTAAAVFGWVLGIRLFRDPRRRSFPVRRWKPGWAVDAFTFQWAFFVGTMLAAGISLDETLAHLAESNTRVSSAARFVRQQMLNGATFSSALGAWPECTRELRAVIDLSMWTGRLDVALLTLADRCAARQRRRIE
ncbi:MAG: type II secretion system F family protein, partial [Alicyclobacillaceae bacterium]|nr:type II secretion system F family protein [Alicyclobacillaceae bacterium]